LKRRRRLLHHGECLGQDLQQHFFDQWPMLFLYRIDLLVALLPLGDIHACGSRLDLRAQGCPVRSLFLGFLRSAMRCFEVRLSLHAGRCCLSGFELGELRFDTSTKGCISLRSRWALSPKPS
jgi:hypothetical protein